MVWDFILKVLSELQAVHQHTFYCGIFQVLYFHFYVKDSFLNPSTQKRSQVEPLLISHPKNPWGMQLAMRQVSLPLFHLQWWRHGLCVSVTLKGVWPLCLSVLVKEGWSSLTALWKRRGLCTFWLYWRRSVSSSDRGIAFVCHSLWKSCGLCACRFQSRRSGLFMSLPVKEVWPVCLSVPEKEEIYNPHKHFYGVRVWLHSYKVQIFLNGCH